MDSNRPHGGRRGAIVAGAAALLGAGLWYGMRTEPAPEVVFSLIDGVKLSSQQLRGKVVLLNFWATSCVTCVKEMPSIVDLFNSFAGRGFETVAVAMSYDRPDYVLKFAETRRLPFRVALDIDGSLARAFGRVAVTPTSFLIGKDGQILERWVGEPDFDKLSQRIDSQLRA
jgi:peroxiredoxin